MILRYTTHENMRRNVPSGFVPILILRLTESSHVLRHRDGV